jgi:hypothetical protein
VVQLIGLNAWCNVTAIIAASQKLPLVAEHRSRQPGPKPGSCLYPWLNWISELDLANYIQEGEGQVLAKALRLNTTVTSLNLERKVQGPKAWETWPAFISLNRFLGPVDDYVTTN